MINWHVQHIQIEWTVAPVLFAKSAIIWNPLIYICMNKQVKKKETKIPVNNWKLISHWWKSVPEFCWYRKYRLFSKLLFTFHLISLWKKQHYHHLIDPLLNRQSRHSMWSDDVLNWKYKNNWFDFTNRGLFPVPARFPLIRSTGIEAASSDRTFGQEFEF